ncbi:AraC family transcriptional regulator ligand-binding domain-containing protein [Zhongshania guokunii]|uniref:AraC family transcriptional regulator ligand-binding domain-containing protein n=1 Tax=Zhongshania guokunii TaxID=641783 RepID=A0ABV3U670_9GAMM
MEQLGARLLRVLWRLLQHRYPAIDCAELGRRCDIGDEWWQAPSSNSLVNVLVLLNALRSQDAPAIALELGDLAQLSDLGLLGYAMLTASNCEQATHISCHAFSEASFLVKVHLERAENHALIRFQLTKNALPIEQLIMELCSVAAWRYVQGILPEGRAAVPDYVELSCSTPDHAARYGELLGCPVHFDSPYNTIALPLNWLQRPIPSGNEQAMIACSHHVQQILSESYRSGGIVPQVKRLLMARPQDCNFQLGNTAKLLRMSPRSLRRHLEQAGSCFRQICLEVRMELAREYLLNTHMSLKEIAYQLGYKHPSNFNRAFSDYYASSPQLMRRSHYATFQQS